LAGKGGNAQNRKRFQPAITITNGGDRSNQTKRGGGKKFQKRNGSLDGKKKKIVAGREMRVQGENPIVCIRYRRKRKRNKKGEIHSGGQSIREK